MKRTFLAAACVSLLAVAAPSIASAHHGKRHHSACAARHHHAKCARAHVLRFGARSALSSGPTTSGAPTTPSTETAGTVKSFSGGILTITLNNGTEVSGKVTEDTEIGCESATRPTSGDDDEGGDESGSSGDSSVSAVAHASSTGSGDDEGENDQGDDEGGAQSCTTTALTPGAVVRAAELEVSGAGAVWEKVDLVV